jgi:hypothetical protein
MVAVLVAVLLLPPAAAASAAADTSQTTAARLLLVVAPARAGVRHWPSTHCSDSAQHREKHTRAFGQHTPARHEPGGAPEGQRLLAAPVQSGKGAPAEPPSTRAVSRAGTATHAPPRQRWPNAQHTASDPPRPPQRDDSGQHLPATHACPGAHG